MNYKDYYSRLNDLIHRNATIWQATIVKAEGSTPAKPGMKMIIPLSEKEFGNLGGGEMEHYIIDFARAEQPGKPIFKTFVLSEAGDAVKDSEVTATSMICGGNVSVFIEPLFQVKKLYVIGAGHCGRALGHLAKLCDFRVILIDNRADIIDSLPPEVHDTAILNDYSTISTAIDFDKCAHVVIMTHGHTHDKEVLQQCLAQQFAYLGMIGSKQKVLQTFARLMEQGIPESQITKVHAPIGLPVGSQTPYEIAVSIMAEIIGESR
ncbi:MAG: XdhC/CoxI family protein [Candidatus Cloacimonadaceae bacterium]|nr:XdhC/CoxI family protein [Candidatus Cloacimonadaceae bacterium]